MGSAQRAMIQEKEVENPPESNPNSDIPQTNTSTSAKSQHLSVVRSKRISKSDGLSKPSGLMSSLHPTKEEPRGEKSSINCTTLVMCFIKNYF